MINSNSNPQISTYAKANDRLIDLITNNPDSVTKEDIYSLEFQLCLELKRVRQKYGVK